MLVSKMRADVNTKNEYGFTALHYAAFNPDLPFRADTILSLIQLGANPDKLEDERLRMYVASVNTQQQQLYTYPNEMEEFLMDTAVKLDTTDMLHIFLLNDMVGRIKDIIIHEIHDTDSRINRTTNMLIQMRKTLEQLLLHSHQEERDKVVELVFQIGGVRRAGKRLDIPKLILMKWVIDYGERNHDSNLSTALKVWRAIRS